MNCRTFNSFMTKICNRWFPVFNLVMGVISIMQVFKKVKHVAYEFFFYQGFLFTGSDDSQDSMGREETIFYSALSLPHACKHSDICFQLCMWDEYHIFLIAPFVFIWLLLDEINKPYRTTIWLIDDMMLIFSVYLMIWF